MQKNLSEILGTEVTQVEYPNYEKTIAIRRDSKAIRLDIHIKGADSVYNIEMPNADFFKAVNGVFSNSEFSATIKSEVDKVKSSNHLRREYMNLYIHDQDLRKAVTKEVTEKVRLKDIVALIKVSQDLGASREITVSKIMEKFSLPEDEVITLVNENWK